MCSQYASRVDAAVDRYLRCLTGICLIVSLT